VLAKVQSRDPLKIPAATFNTFVDSARDYLQRQQGTGGKATQTFRQTGIVLVKNNSGADRGRFAALGIDASVFTPTESIDSFKNTVAVKCVTPAAGHTGSFVVLLEPIIDGEIGRAVVSGVTPVKVDVADEAHAYADIAVGQAGYLASGESGSALILWKETGTGQKWALVKIGMPSAEPSMRTFPAKVVSSQGSAAYTVREQAITAAGSFVDKAGTSNVTAKNLAELTLGTGSAVDTGEIVLVTSVIDQTGGMRYIFDHPAYAKYLD